MIGYNSSNPDVKKISLVYRIECWDPEMSPELLPSFFKTFLSSRKEKLFQTIVSMMKNLDRRDKLKDIISC